MNEESKAEHNLLVLSILRPKLRPLFEQLAVAWEKYFFIDQQFDTPDHIEEYISKQVGILFLDVKFMTHFQYKYYGMFQEKFPHFMYIAVGDKPSESDIKTYKALADQIIHAGLTFELVKWKSIAIMRRYWNTFSKPSTIIYKNIVADFVDRRIQVNNRHLYLTTKEFELIKLLIENRGQYISKKTIMNKVWGYDEDTTRVLDQIIFKLKSKIGREYFVTHRQKGVKFE